MLGVGRGGFLPRCNRRSFHFVSSCPRSSSRSLHDPSSFRLKRLPCSRPGRGLMPLVVHWSGRDGLWVSPGPHSRLKPPPISRSKRRARRLTPRIIAGWYRLTSQRVALSGHGAVRDPMRERETIHLKARDSFLVGSSSSPATLPIIQERARERLPPSIVVAEGLPSDLLER